MTSSVDLERIVGGSRVAEAVFALRPDYRAVLLAVDGIVPGPSDAASDELLARAESHARQLLAGRAAEELPEIVAWREAYRAFGAKPQRTRNSLEALMRRADTGLPRVNRLTDVYNAVSVRHSIPLGGEDLTGYVGCAHLVRAEGTEPFETTVDGTVRVERPEPGEVVWRDDAGVTCRRWNWRQTTRTRLHDGTTTALFILDALDPVTDDAVAAAVAELLEQLRRFSPGLTVARGSIGPGDARAGNA